MSRPSLHAIAAELRGTCPGNAFMRAWLEPTWQNQAGFAAELDSVVERHVAPAGRTRVETAVDLFQECALLHTASLGPALIERDRSRFAPLSYARLCEEACSLATTWRQAGVKHGMCVAIVMPVSRSYLVCLFAAFHLGAVAAPVPPSGRRYVKRRIEQLAPDFLVTLAECASWFDAEARFLPSRGEQPTQSQAHAYEPEAPALRVISAFRSFEQEPVELGARELLHALVRDGLLALTLGFAERVAAPGFDALQTQPLMLLTVLRMGATWVELDEQDVLDDPSLLGQAGVQRLGVTRAVRNRLLELGDAELPKLRAWFRLLNETYDYVAWDDFRARMAKQNCPGFAVLSSAASCGVSLSTQPSLVAQAQCVWPRAGENWTLSQVGTDGFRAWHASGVYTPLRLDRQSQRAVPDATGPHIVLTENGDGWTFAGSVDSWPDSRALPLEDIARVASRHPRVGAAAACIAPGRWANEANLTLGLFVPTRDELGRVEDLAQLHEEVTAHLVWELGRSCAPARIEVFPLYPRWKKDMVDLNWFREQYLSGALYLRAQEPLFIALAQLSWAFDSSYAEKSKP